FREPSMSRWSFLFGVAAAGLLLGGRAAAEDEPVTVRLADGGKARLPIVVSEKAPEGVRKAAETLADYLGRISGARFEVVRGDSKDGIVVGLAGRELGDVKDLFHAEDYLLRSRAEGLDVLAASEQAVEHAVWDLLFRLGHRQFFPGPTWEVVPK